MVRRCLSLPSTSILRESRDTVLLVGIIRRKENVLENTERHACIIWHALVLDKHRVKFVLECILHDQKLPNVKEVWFAGVHSDV